MILAYPLAKDYWALSLLLRVGVL